MLNLLLLVLLQQPSGFTREVNFNFGGERVPITTSTIKIVFNGFSPADMIEVRKSEKLRGFVSIQSVPVRNGVIVSGTKAYRLETAPGLFAFTPISSSDVSALRVQVPGNTSVVVELNGVSYAFRESVFLNQGSQSDSDILMLMHQKLFNGEWRVPPNRVVEADTGYRVVPVNEAPLLFREPVILSAEEQAQADALKTAVVMLKVTVSKAGEVTSVQIVRNHLPPPLIVRVQEAVRKYRYQSIGEPFVTRVLLPFGKKR